MKVSKLLAGWVWLLVAGEVAADSVCPQDLLPKHDLIPVTAADLQNGQYVIIFDPLENDRSETGRLFELMSLELLNAGSSTLNPNSDGTLTFTGLPEEVGIKQATYTLRSDDNVWRNGTIEFRETGDGYCGPTARADSFTIPEGFGEYLDVLANDAQPLCAQVHLLPFPNDNLGPTAAGGTVQRVVLAGAELVYYRPPLYNYRGTDSFSYTSEVNGITATALVTVSVVPTNVSPAFACYFPLGQPARTTLDFDTYCSRPSTRECQQPYPGGNVVARAQINTRCWNFGHEGNPSICNDNWTGGWVLHGPHGVCVDANQDLRDDVTGFLCTHYPTKVTHVYPTFGTHFVKLTIGDTCGGASQMTREIEVVNRPPLPSFTVVACNGLTCSFDARATTDDWGLGTLRWNFGDDTPFVTGPLVEHAFPRLGSYTVQLVAEDVDGLSDVTVQTVNLVDQPPVPAFRWTCSDLTCVLTSETTDDWGLTDERWRWRRVGAGPAVTFAVGRQTEFTAPMPGTYEFTLRATDTLPQTAEIRQQIDILGVLTAVSDNVVLPAGANSVSFQPLVNDRGPVLPLTLVDVSPPARGTVSIGAGGTVTYTATGTLRSDVTDVFAYRIADSSGQQASGLIRVVAQPIGQVGRIADLSTTPRRVTFQTAFSEPPVVIAAPAQALWKDPVVARVTAVDSTGFTVFLQEPPGTADGGTHLAEAVFWLALVPTLRQLPNGEIEGGLGMLEGSTPFAAGRFELGSDAGSWARLVIPENPLGGGLTIPVVFAQTQTNRDPGWAVTGLDEVRPSGFSVALKPYQARATDHAVETIGWVALPSVVISSGSGSVLFEAGATLPEFDAAFRNLQFQQSYPRTPVVIAGQRSSLDQDPAVVRYRGLKGDTIEFRLEEEQTADLDLQHTPELLSYLVVEEALVLSGRPTPPDPATGGSSTLESIAETSRRQQRYVQAMDDVAWYRGKSLQSVTIPVLRNDRGRRSDLAIAWLNPPVHGLAWVHAPGIIRYQPPPNFCGEDFFTYWVTDGDGQRSYAAVRVRREKTRGNGQGQPDPCETTGGGGVQ